MIMNHDLYYAMIYITPWFILRHDLDYVLRSDLIYVTMATINHSCHQKKIKIHLFIYFIFFVY